MTDRSSYASCPLFAPSPLYTVGPTQKMLLWNYIDVRRKRIGQKNESLAGSGYLEYNIRFRLGEKGAGSADCPARKTTIENNNGANES